MVPERQAIAIATIRAWTSVTVALTSCLFAPRRRQQPLNTTLTGSTQLVQLLAAEPQHRSQARRRIQVRTHTTPLRRFQVHWEQRIPKTTQHLHVRTVATQLQRQHLANTTSLATDSVILRKRHEGGAFVTLDAIPMMTVAPTGKTSAVTTLLHHVRVCESLAALRPLSDSKS